MFTYFWANATAVIASSSHAQINVPHAWHHYWIFVDCGYSFRRWCFAAGTQFQKALYVIPATRSSRAVHIRIWEAHRSFRECNDKRRYLYTHCTPRSCTHVFEARSTSLRCKLFVDNAFRSGEKNTLRVHNFVCASVESTHELYRSHENGI